jgi:hypothetical protein
MFNFYFRKVFKHFIYHRLNSFSLGKVNQACDYLKNDNELLIKPGIV